MIVHTGLVPASRGGGISEKRRKRAKMPYFQDKSQHPRGCLKFAKKIRGCFYTIENQDLHVQVNLTTLMFFGTPYRAIMPSGMSKNDTPYGKYSGHYDLSRHVLSVQPLNCISHCCIPLCKSSICGR